MCTDRNIYAIAGYINGVKVYKIVEEDAKSGVVIETKYSDGSNGTGWAISTDVNGSVIVPMDQYGEGVPLNSTVKALVRNTVITLVANTQTSITLAAGTESVEYVWHAIPSAPIFISYGYGSNDPASATAHDDIISPAKLGSQLGKTNGCTHISFFSTVGTTISLIQR